MIEIFPEMSTDLSRVSIPCCVQPKYDGECVKWTGDRLVNRYGRERYLPFCDQLPKDKTFAGELYFKDGKRNFYEALTYLKGDSPLLKFAIFALWNVKMPYVEQIKTMDLLVDKSEAISVVEGMNAYSHMEVEHYCKYYLAQGYEGAVIKPLMASGPESWIKFKPDQEVDLLVLGVSKVHNSIAVGRPDGEVLGHCSLIGHDDVRAAIGTHVVIGDTREDYLITPDIVVEVKHLGFIPPGGHLRSPRIGRLREDLRPEHIKC